MPAVSEAQRRYLNWRFGHAWVEAHHFDNTGKLPARLGSKYKTRLSARRRGRKS